MPGPFTVKDSTGTTQNVAEINDASNNCVFPNTITDGAGAILVTSAERAAALGVRPRARIVASAVVGDDPTLMLTGPIPATARVLERAGLSIDDIDAVEVNEAHQLQAIDRSRWALKRYSRVGSPIFDALAQFAWLLLVTPTNP